MAALDKRLPFRRLWALAQAFARQYALDLPPLPLARYRFSDSEPIPVVTTNGNGSLWIDREYVAYALPDGLVHYVYATRHHIYEELYGYSALRRWRKNPPELPREIMCQFRAMLRAMNLNGADYYVSEEWTLPEEKNLEPDAGME